MDRDLIVSEIELFHLDSMISLILKDGSTVNVQIIRDRYVPDVSITGYTIDDKNVNSYVVKWYGITKDSEWLERLVFTYQIDDISDIDQLSSEFKKELHEKFAETKRNNKKSLQ